MIGLKFPPRRAAPDEAEKPFWISFSDLMTALMVLFLIAMAVALMAVTQGLRQIEVQKKDRDAAIQLCLDEVRAIVERPEFRGVTLRGQELEFGPLAEFRKDGNELSLGKRMFLRRFVPQFLEAAKHPSCAQWLKRVVVEGYASQEGSYLYNLNLSLERSQRVLCVLLDASVPDALHETDRRRLRTLFLVGGSSFNAVKKNPEESRRVELKLEFKDVGKTCLPELHDCDEAAPADIPWDEDSKCPVTNR